METKQNKSAYFKYAELRSLEVEITELETKITTVYFSIRKAAKAINSNIKTILHRENNK
jgi:hypothetical protein